MVIFFYNISYTFYLSFFICVPCVEPDPYSEYGSGLTKLLIKYGFNLDLDPNTGCNGLCSSFVYMYDVRVHL